MKNASKCWAIFIFIVIFLLPGSFNIAVCQEDMIRAKIGIQISSGSQIKMAKSRDRIKSGDLIRIFVHPERASFIYVIYSDRKEASLLNIVQQKMKSATLVLPSMDDAYEIDGASEFELFTIICSPVAMPEVTDLLGTQTAYTKWAVLEEELIKKSRVMLNDKGDIPFAIAGNVRGGASRETNASFVKKMRIFSGNFFVIKTYAFNVIK